MRYETVAIISRVVEIILLVVICWGLIRQVWYLRDQGPPPILRRISFWVAWTFIGWLWVSVDRIRILSFRDVIDDWPSIPGLWFGNVGLIGLLVTLHWGRIKPLVRRWRMAHRRS